MSGIRRVALVVDRNPVLAGMILAMLLPIGVSALRLRWRRQAWPPMLLS